MGEPKKEHQRHQWLKEHVDTQSFNPKMMMPLALNPKVSFSKASADFTQLTSNALASLCSLDLRAQLGLCEKEKPALQNPLNLGMSSLDQRGASQQVLFNNSYKA